MINKVTGGLFVFSLTPASIEWKPKLLTATDAGSSFYASIAEADKPGSGIREQRAQVKLTELN